MSNNCGGCGEVTDVGIWIGGDYTCSDCACYECGRCGKLIDFDEDISADDVFPEDDSRYEFSDGSHKVHEECLTKEEKKLLDIQWNS